MVGVDALVVEDRAHVGQIEAGHGERAYVDPAQGERPYQDANAQLAYHRWDAQKTLRHLSAQLGGHEYYRQLGDEHCDGIQQKCVLRQVLK